MPKFSTPFQEKLFKSTAQQLRQVGYQGELFQADYRFRDYFSRAGIPERQIALALFGQLPLNFQNACLGVILSYDGTNQGASLIQDYRALGAPIQIEVRPDRAIVWIVGSTPSSIKPYGEFDSETKIANLLHSAEWSPEQVLRAKNIGFTSPKSKPRQLDFYDLGLMPALEEQVKQKLDPMLRDALAATVEAHKKATGHTPDDRDMFRLAFRLLAGKAFHDAGIASFAELNDASGPDAVLKMVASHYRETLPRLLNIATREAAFKWIWSGLDFRHLSVDVLAHIWTHTLVSDEVREKFGIHITPRTVAKYVVDRLPFEEFLNDNSGNQLVVDVCCGPATFLVSATQRIRDLTQNLTPTERHVLLQKILVGFEQGSFGVEIARLCLSLADFPQPNGWEIHEQDVYTSKVLPQSLSRAGIVLCNPPFQDLPRSHPHRDKVDSVHQPAEILRRVLESINPSGVLGFVMPRKFLSGAWYPGARKELVERFGNIELVSLPDVAFRESESGHETVLVLATQPRKGGTSATVRHRRVSSADWERFTQFHEPTSDDVAIKSVAEGLLDLSIPALGEVWRHLVGYPRLGQLANISRGIEWKKRLRKKGKETGHRNVLVLDESHQWTREGVPPRSHIADFQCPATKHLDMRPEEQRRNAFQCPWDLPKVILNATRRSRGPWRLSAFADYNKLTCYRTFIAVWPKDPKLTTAIAAVLNGPVANALAATFDGPNISLKQLHMFPMPHFSETLIVEVGRLVSQYLVAAQSENWSDADLLLRLIDASVLEAYDLPPRVERKLLDYFRGSRRPVPFPFGDYFPANFQPCFPLAEYLAGDFQLATAKSFRERGEPPKQVLQVLSEFAKSGE